MKRLRLVCPNKEAVLGAKAGDWPTLAQRLTQAKTRWRKVKVNWCGDARRFVETPTDTAVWCHSGLPPVPLRWVLIRDPQGRFDPQALLCTGLQLSAREIISAFMCRWAMESHLPGSQGAPGLGGPASVERSVHRALDSPAPGAFLAGHPLRRAATRLAGQRAAGRVVGKDPAHLLGRACPSAPCPLATKGFMPAGREHRQTKITRRSLGSPR